MQHARSVTVLAALVALAAPARADEREVDIYVPAGGVAILDYTRLRDAIRIHTRDVARGEAGRLKVSCDAVHEKSAQVMVTLYVSPPGQPMVMVRVRGRLDTNLYRALALKVRAALVGDPSLTRVDAAPENMVPAPSRPAPSAATPPVAGRPAGTPSPATTTPSPTAARTPGLSGSAARPPAASPSARLPGSPAAGNVEPASPQPATVSPAPKSTVSLPATALSQFAPGGPTDSSQRGLSVSGVLRRTRPLHLWFETGFNLLGYQGVPVHPAFSAAVVLSVGPVFEVAVGGTVDVLQPAVRNAAGSVEMSVWGPLFASLRMVYRTNRLNVGFGLRGGVVFVTALGPSRNGGLLTEYRQIPILGPDFLVRYRIYGRTYGEVYLQSSFRLDGHLTNPEVRVDGMPVLDLGWVSWEAGILGVAYTIP